MDLQNLLFWFGISILFEVYALEEAVITPVNASASENNPVTLSCTLMGTTATAQYFTWILKRSSETESVAVGFFESTCETSVSINTSVFDYACPNRSQSIWTIKNVTRQNQGDRYQCRIDTSSKNLNCGFTFLNVQVPVSSVSMTIPIASEVTIKENTEEEFECKTTGGLPAVTVAWYKDPGTPKVFSDDVEVTSKIETSSSTVNDLIEVTSTLRYSPSRIDNGWRIYCTSRNINEQKQSVSQRKILLIIQSPINTCSCNGETNKTVMILGVTLGIVCAVLAVYAMSLTILYRRKTTPITGAQSTQKSTEQATCMNMTVHKSEADKSMRNTKENVNRNKDDTARQHTDLVQHSEDDSVLYDIIQTAD